MSTIIIFAADNLKKRLKKTLFLSSTKDIMNLIQTQIPAKTLLYDWHVKNGAKMVPFAGFMMPIQYTSPIEEHHQVRNSAGIFDIDHMAQFKVTGIDAAEFLNKAVSANVLDLGLFQSKYALMCNENGCVLDDLFIYKLAQTEFMIVANASNRQKDFKYLEQNIKNYNAQISDISDDLFMIALQGSKAINIIDFADITRFYSKYMDIFGVKCLVGRTGYTGEDGVEIFVPINKALEIWQKLIDNGAKPIGLAARDSLRFEPGFSLYGHEAGLAWACDFNKDFIGKDAFYNKEIERKLVTFEMIDKGVARENYGVFDAQNNKIGFVASGMYAPTVDKFAGNAFVCLNYAKINTEIFIDVRGKLKKARIIKRPLYKPAYKKQEN
jgi:glycine cleavage system T protein